MVEIKNRKGNTIIDIIIALMIISTVLYFCYSLATSAINKRQQINLEREAMTIAENIMNRVLSKGVYAIQNEPFISDATMIEIEDVISDNSLNLAEKNAKIMEIGGRLPVKDIDAPFLPKGDVYRNQYSYQIIVDDYTELTGTDQDGKPTYMRHTGLKRIVINVYYPSKVIKYTNNNISSVEDIASLEEEIRVVTLTTYKASREY